MKNKLKEIRHEQHLTQEKLAEKSGISRTTLTMIELGKTIPDGTTIAKLVLALGVPANEIFFDLDVVRKQQGVE